MDYQNSIRYISTMFIRSTIKSTILLFIRTIFSPFRMEVFRYADPFQKKIYDRCRLVRDENRTLLSCHELYVLNSFLRQVDTVSGGIAEVGIYKGGSAKLLSLEKKNKTLYLFDTFEGLPQTTGKDDTFHRKGMYAETYAAVRKYLSGFKNVFIYKGYFPQTTGPIKHKRFSFVHLDVDLYKTTLGGLKFFYPRMNKGGVIITHDYPTLEGVRRAYQEFARIHKLTIIEIPPAQAVLIKS